MADFIVDDEQMSSEPSGSDNDEDYARTSKLVALQKGDDAAPTARCVLSMGMCAQARECGPHTSASAYLLRTKRKRGGARVEDDDSGDDGKPHNGRLLKVSHDGFSHKAQRDTLQTLTTATHQEQEVVLQPLRRRRHQLRLRHQLQLHQPWPLPAAIVMMTTELEVQLEGGRNASGGARR